MVTLVGSTLGGLAGGILKDTFSGLFSIAKEAISTLPKGSVSMGNASVNL